MENLGIQNFSFFLGFCSGVAFWATVTLISLLLEENLRLRKRQ